jgi:hypothetical protein
MFFKKGDASGVPRRDLYGIFVETRHAPSLRLAMPHLYGFQPF